MPVSQDADRYNMDHLYRGKCVIFNQENFINGFSARLGTRGDATRIQNTFEKLGFSVEICYDYEFGNIQKKINERKY